MQPKEIGHSGVTVAYTDGAVVISAFEGKVTLNAKASVVVQPVLDKFKADVQSGKIDLIHGTDLDATLLLQAVSYLEKELNK